MSLLNRGVRAEVFQAVGFYVVKACSQRPDLEKSEIHSVTKYQKCFTEEM
jgi:hypothetical protein